MDMFHVFYILPLSKQTSVAIEQIKRFCYVPDSDQDFDAVLIDEEILEPREGRMLKLTAAVASW